MKTNEYLAKQAACQAEQAWKKQRLREEKEAKEQDNSLKEFHDNIASWVAKQLLAKVRGMGAADKAVLTAKCHTEEVLTRGKAKRFFLCSPAWMLARRSREIWIRMSSAGSALTPRLGLNKSITALSAIILNGSCARVNGSIIAGMV